MGFFYCENGKYLSLVFNHRPLFGAKAGIPIGGVRDSNSVLLSSFIVLRQVRVHDGKRPKGNSLPQENRRSRVAWGALHTLGKVGLVSLL